jgi:hypothetical protein
MVESQTQWNHGGIMVESWWNHGGITKQWNHGGIMVESWWNHGVESHLRRSFCDSTMIPLQIYDSTKTTIIPLVELWWNYRGGITKIVSERIDNRRVELTISCTQVI